MRKNLLEISHRRKRRWVLIKWVSWLAVIFIFLALVVLIFYIPRFRINSVELSGFESVDQKAALAEVSDIISGRYFYIIPKNNVLFLPKSELENLFKNNLRIQNFSIQRNLSSKLTITIKERKTWAVWCAFAGGAVSSCGLSDDEGFVFAPAPSVEGSAILKILDERGGDMIGKTFISKNDLELINNVINRLPQKFNERVSAIEIKKGPIYHLDLKSGWYLILDSEIKNSDIAFENLALTLNTLKEKKDNLEYVDLRFEGKVFYKMKDAMPSL